VVDDPALVDDWHPVVACDELAARRLVGVRLLGEDIVVWRADGRARAWQDLPPPRKARVRTYRALERYGLVWVSLGQPAHEVPSFPEWDDDGLR
jgi:phenylpropionate dioxygenase-like ring-hydroxylating dioxygenase large terminal subunit